MRTEALSTAHAQVLDRYWRAANSRSEIYLIDNPCLAGMSTCLIRSARGFSARQPVTGDRHERGCAAAASDLWLPVVGGIDVDGDDIQVLPVRRHCLDLVGTYQNLWV
jgi:hypothetical protein